MLTLVWCNWAFKTDLWFSQVTEWVMARIPTQLTTAVTAAPLTTHPTAPRPSPGRPTRRPPHRLPPKATCRLTHSGNLNNTISAYLCVENS